MANPEQIRRRRRAQAELDRTLNAGFRNAIEAALQHGADIVVPELIPTEQDQRQALREARKLAQAAVGHPRGSSGYRRKADELLPLISRLVYMDRVMALGRLERAALTPRKLMDMASVSPADMQAKLVELSSAETTEGSNAVVQGHADPAPRGRRFRLRRRRRADVS